MPRCARAECGVWRADLRVWRRRPSGVLFEGDWYCSTPCVEHAAATRLLAADRPRPAGGPTPLPPLKLGMLLVHHGVMTPAALDRALQAQRASGRRLGEELLALGLADRAQVLRALATQSNAPWLLEIDPRQVRQVPSALGHDAVRALGLVPFEMNESRRRVKVACVAPVPRLALRALTELTGWVADPFIVADDLLPTLVAAYDAGLGERASRPGRPAALSPRDAAAHIARVAAASGGATMIEAQCDPYVWVRVETDAGVDDVLVQRSARQEQTWQAAPTLH